MSNPLIGLEGLPPFSTIQPAHVVPALKAAIEHCRTTIDEVLASREFTWQGLVVPLEEADDKLSRMWSPVSHMHSVVNSCLLYTSPSPRDRQKSRMPSSA